MAGGLDRVLGLTDLLWIGVASIMGSGGFNLISEGVVNGGRWFPAAIGIVATLFQGASKVYSEAYAAFKSNTAETDMVKGQFGSVAEGITGLGILGFNIFSVSTILVFAAKDVFPKGSWAGQVGLALLILLGMTGISLKGMDVNRQVIGLFSAVIIGLLSFASIIGLVEGFGPTGTPPEAFPSTLQKTPDFKASIFFFYFILAGFDALMKFVEESRDPDNDIPRAFFMSNGLSTLLTAGVAYAYVHVLTLQKNGRTLHTENALGLIFESALGKPAGNVVYWLGIGLMIVTAFVSFLATTRYLYSVSDGEEKREEPFANWLRELNDAKVPWRSVALTAAIAATGILINHTYILVEITDFFLTSTIISVAAATTVYKYKKTGQVPWIEGLTTAGFAALLVGCCVPTF